MIWWKHWDGEPYREPDRGYRTQYAVWDDEEGDNAMEVVWDDQSERPSRWAVHDYSEWNPATGRRVEHGFAKVSVLVHEDELMRAMKPSDVEDVEDGKVELLPFVAAFGAYKHLRLGEDTWELVDYLPSAR